MRRVDDEHVDARGCEGLGLGGDIAVDPDGRGDAEASMQPRYSPPASRSTMPWPTMAGTSRSASATVSCGGSSMGVS
jgi:hypothetical protein